MRYLFIDRIQRLEIGKKIVAIKNITLSEDIFLDHFMGFPVMPGALLVECIAQAGTALLEVSGGHTRKALPVILKQAMFRKLVRPGDQLTVTMTVVSSDAEFVQMDGTIHVKETLVMDARMTFVLSDPAEFFTPLTRPFMEATYKIWLRDAEIIGSLPPGGDPS